MLNKEKLDQIRRQQEQVAAWLDEQCPYAMVDQKHLEEATPERTYWHYGYHAALRDVLRLLEEADQEN